MRQLSSRFSTKGRLKLSARHLSYRLRMRRLRARKLLKKAAAASLVQVKIEEEAEFENNSLNGLAQEITIKEELPDYQEENTKEGSYSESDQHEQSSQCQSSQIDNSDHQYAIPQ